MYKMRRKDRAVESERAKRFLAAGEWGTLSTVDAQGQPYGVPISYIVLEDTLYFHSAKTGHKISNIQKEPRVCFSVAGNTKPVYEKNNFTTLFESVVVFGKAALVEDSALKHRVLAALCMKYLPEYEGEVAESLKAGAAHTDVYGICIEHITGKLRGPHEG